MALEKFPTKWDPSHLKVFMVIVLVVSYLGEGRTYQFFFSEVQQQCALTPWLDTESRKP